MGYVPQQAKEDSVRAREIASHFFSDVDKGSATPSWYYEDTLVAEMKERIDNAERQLSEDLVPQDKKAFVKDQLKRDRYMHDNIMEAKERAMHVIKQDPDKWKKIHSDLEKQISASLFSRDEMNHKPRLVNPREEAERMKYRNSQITAYRVIGKLMDLDTNIERLRKGK